MTSTGRSRGAVIGVIVASLLTSIALAVVALHWSATADTARTRTATYESEARQSHARRLAARAGTDTLKLEAVKVVNAFDDVDRAIDAVASSQTSTGQAGNDAIALYNHGDFPAARAKFSGDVAAAVADVAAKTASANTALATLQQAIADLRAGNGG